MERKERDQAVLGGKFSSAEGIGKDDGFARGEAFQFSPGSIFHEPGKVGKLSLVDGGNQEVEAQALEPNDGDFLIDFFGFNVSHLLDLDGHRILESEVDAVNQSCEEEDKIKDENKRLFPVSIVSVESDKPDDGPCKQEDGLDFEDVFGFCAEE